MLMPLVHGPLSRAKGARLRRGSAERGKNGNHGEIREGMTRSRRASMMELQCITCLHSLPCGASQAGASVAHVSATVLEHTASQALLHTGGGGPGAVHSKGALPWLGLTAMLAWALSSGVVPTWSSQIFRLALGKTDGIASSSASTQALLLEAKV